MTNWIAANLVTWWFDAHEAFKNSAEGGKVGYIIPLKNVGVVTPKALMDVIFPGSQANGGFWIAVIIAIAMWVMMTKTTFGYELRACGSNRHAAKYAGILAIALSNIKQYYDEKYDRNNFIKNVIGKEIVF